jgi:hypothetical protein
VLGGISANSRLNHTCSTTTFVLGYWSIDLIIGSERTIIFQIGCKLKPMENTIRLAKPGRARDIYLLEKSGIR